MITIVAQYCITMAVLKSVTRAKAHVSVVLSAIALVKTVSSLIIRQNLPKIDRLSLRHNEEKAWPVRVQ